MPPESPKHSVIIYYCTRCRWLLRAGWTAQELLVSFEDDLTEVSLRPGAGGQFDILLDGELIWCRKDEGGFPELREIKQRLRNIIDPQRDLGHSDRPANDDQ